MVSVDLQTVDPLLTLAFTRTATSCIKYCSSKNYVYAGTEYSSGEKQPLEICVWQDAKR
jgi:uncharacterized protein CbrC (UPF0167 family)